MRAPVKHFLYMLQLDTIFCVYMSDPFKIRIFLYVLKLGITFCELYMFWPSPVAS